MKVLVCGGAGYIGSHAVAGLLERGMDVVVADNLEKGYRAAVMPDAHFYQGDLRNLEFVESIFSENRIDAVLDFAAYSLVGESMSEPLKYFNNNVYGTMNLLTAMNKGDCDKIVFSSTAATYGEPQSIPIVETDPTVPKNPYGESKLAVEKMLRWCDEAYGIKYVSLRYFNVAGAHKSGKIGENHLPETHIIPVILKAALAPGTKVKIFGNDYPTPDGTCIRDYIHILDLIDAHVIALEKLFKGGSSDIFNLGNGKGFSVNELITAARRVTGCEIPVEQFPRRAGDPSTLIASSRKISDELGWKTKYPGIDEIIADAWNWHRTHPNGYSV